MFRRSRRRAAGLVAAWLALAAAGSLPATESGDAVVVVFNSAVPESKRVADHYAQRRQVPAAQVIGLRLPDREVISRAEFRDLLQRPLRSEFETRGLFTFGTTNVPATDEKPAQSFRVVTAAKVRYAVLCFGVPLKVASDPGLVEPGTEELRPELQRNEAAVDSELALLPLEEAKHPLAGPFPNRFYGATNAAALHPTNGLLLVARLDGPTAAIARGLVDKAIEAETDGLWGRAYFDARGITDPNYKQGDDWIRAAAQMARQLGWETVLDEKPETFPAGYPLSHVGYYAGWYDGEVSGPFARADFEFMPGAFAYHLHSFSAATLRTTTRHWVGPLLARGATVTLGCVEEPYLAGTPDIAVFTRAFLFGGFSFGEAACAAQGSLSWQTTVVGDPLYRPFALSAQQRHEDLLRRRSELVEWSHLRLVNLGLARNLGAGPLIEYLEKEPAAQRSAVLQEKLGDLYHVAGKLFESAGAYRRALDLARSGPQQARVTLFLARTLALIDREEEAYALYQKFLAENPDHPERASVLERLLTLARKLQRTADAERYQIQLFRLAPPPPR